MPPVIYDEACIGCGQCVDACQCDVYFGSEPGAIATVTHPEECWHCYACVFACPVEDAIKLRIPLPMMVLYKRQVQS